MTKVSRSAPRGAFRSGIRDGLRGLVSIGRYGHSPARVRKQVGSFRTDGLDRVSDARRFGEDVRQHEPVGSR